MRIGAHLDPDGDPCTGVPEVTHRNGEQRCSRCLRRFERSLTDQRWDRVREALSGVRNRGGFWVDIADAAVADLDQLRLTYEAAVRAAIAAREVDEEVTTFSHGSFDHGSEDMLCAARLVIDKRERFRTLLAEYVATVGTPGERST